MTCLAAFETALADCLGLGSLNSCHDQSRLDFPKPAVSDRELARVDSSVLCRCSVQLRSVCTCQVASDRGHT